MSENDSLKDLVSCVADRAAILLSTEVVLHDELNDTRSHDETARKVNAQLLDLFNAQAANSEAASSGLNVVLNGDVLGAVQTQLKRQLHAARLEREQEQKMWEQQQQNSGWDSSFWGSSSKREGRRSPFRAFTRMTSTDSIQ